MNGKNRGFLFKIFLWCCSESLALAIRTVSASEISSGFSQQRGDDGLEADGLVQKVVAGPKVNGVTIGSTTRAARALRILADDSATQRVNGRGK